jgi:hypothetical protein
MLGGHMRGSVTDDAAPDREGRHPMTFPYAPQTLRFRETVLKNPGILWLDGFLPKR